jgi:toxin ParE1/3/4
LGWTVRFTPQAEADLRSIFDWIAVDDDRAAERVLSRIRQAVTMFEQFPYLGHPGDVAGTREFTVTGLPYMIVYAVPSETDVDILTVIHNSRLYPPE